MLDVEHWTFNRSLTPPAYKVKLRLVRADGSGRWFLAPFGLRTGCFMNAEFVAMLDYLERERGIKREILLEAVSNALLSASKKSVGAARDLHIDINPKTGDIRALANLVVVDQVANPQDEIELSKASKIKPDVNVGEIL